MSKLKRWVALGVAFVLIMGLAGCGKSAESGKATDNGKASGKDDGEPAGRIQAGAYRFYFSVLQSDQDA